jgi:hypothetical protein
MLEGMRLGLLYALCETTFRGTDEYEDLKTVCAKLAAEVDPEYLPDVEVGLFVEAKMLPERS